MAMNQVSLSFFSPRWDQRLTPVPSARTDDGTPVQIADAVPVPGMGGHPLPVAAVTGWLSEQGFTAAGRGGGRALERGLVRSIFGAARDTIVHVNGVAGEVSDLCCRFTLTRDIPPLAEWAAFAVAVCGRFELRLVPGGRSPCGELEFLTAVRGARNYREFAVAFGWEGDRP